jgi:hypothetical protein
MDRVATITTNSISLARVFLNACNNLRSPEGRCTANLDSSDSQPSLRDCVVMGAERRTLEAPVNTGIPSQLDTGAGIGLPPGFV